VEALVHSTAAWLTVGDDALRHCEVSDDALDALIAALVARAHAVGHCAAIASNLLDTARAEGWIALPQAGSLHQLT
jgi:hypothetical protein